MRQWPTTRQDASQVTVADAGQTPPGAIELDPGAYTCDCSVPGQRQAGIGGFALQ